MPGQHTLLGGKVYVYKGPKSSLWQCSSYLAGKNRRVSIKGESLAIAKEISCAEIRSGEIKSEKTFREVSAHYLPEYDIMTQGQRNQRYVDGQRWRSSVHLVPFFKKPGCAVGPKPYSFGKTDWDAALKRRSSRSCGRYTVLETVLIAYFA